METSRVPLEKEFSCPLFSHLIRANIKAHSSGYTRHNNKYIDTHRVQSRKWIVGTNRPDHMIELIEIKMYRSTVHRQDFQNNSKIALLIIWCRWSFQQRASCTKTYKIDCLVSMRCWSWARALPNQQALPQWTAEIDSDSATCSDDCLLVFAGDVVEQWQATPNRWIYGRVIHSCKERSTSDNIFGWYRTSMEIDFNALQKLGWSGWSPDKRDVRITSECHR